MQKLFKIGIGLSVILILISAQLDPGFLPMVHVECLEDNFFTWTKDMNASISRLPSLKHSITIVLGLIMDGLAITCFYKWITDIHRSWTFPLAICLTYALKIFI